MKFPPIYSLSPGVKKKLYQLDVLKSAYDINPLPPDREALVRDRSLLKSAIYSARIEGNPLGLTDLAAGGESNHHREIANLANVYRGLAADIRENLSAALLKKFHLTLMQGLTAEAGHFRMEESAIYNQAGIAVYLTPPPGRIPGLLSELIGYAQTYPDPAPVVAAAIHIWFEKIHPFMDGNGGVGRLLSSYILMKGGYGFSGLVPFEEYMEKNRDAYYLALSREGPDISGFIELYITALVTQAEISLRQARETAASPDPYLSLLPRRAEIMRIIADHRIVSFDFIHRRFRAVPSRTLHYDLSELVKEGLLAKMGSTRGARYTLNDKKSS